MKEGKLYQSFRVRLLRDFLTHKGSLVNYSTGEQKVSYLKKKIPVIVTLLNSKEAEEELFFLIVP